MLHLAALAGEQGVISFWPPIHVPRSSCPSMTHLSLTTCKFHDFLQLCKDPNHPPNLVRWISRELPPEERHTHLQEVSEVRRVCSVYETGLPKQDISQPLFYSDGKWWGFLKKISEKKNMEWETFTTTCALRFEWPELTFYKGLAYIVGGGPKVGVEVRWRRSCTAPNITRTKCTEQDDVCFIKCKRSSIQFFKISLNDCIQPQGDDGEGVEMTTSVMIVSPVQIQLLLSMHVWLFAPLFSFTGFIPGVEWHHWQYHVW